MKTLSAAFPRRHISRKYVSPSRLVGVSALHPLITGANGNKYTVLNTFDTLLHKAKWIREPNINRGSKHTTFDEYVCIHTGH